MHECEEAVAELEAQLTFQQEAIDELNKSVAAQMNQIVTLNDEIDQLKETIRQLMESLPGDSQKEPPPPHY